MTYLTSISAADPLLIAVTGRPGSGHLGPDGCPHLPPSRGFARNERRSLRSNARAGRPSCVDEARRGKAGSSDQVAVDLPDAYGDVVGVVVRIRRADRAR